jgi:hypothetical protein
MKTGPSLSPSSSGVPLGARTALSVRASFTRRDVRRRAGRCAPFPGRRPLRHWIREAIRGAAKRCLTLPARKSGIREAMNDFRNTPMPADGGGPDIDRKALWVIRELGLPAIVKACVSCGSTRHRPTGKFRVNANGKLLDVWMLICCEGCGATSKIPVHERIHVRSLEHGRLLMFENNDPAMVRQLAMDASLAGKSGYQLDWSGTWELETDMPFHELEHGEPAPLEVVVRFELPAPIRVEKLLTAGFGLSRSAVRRMVDSGRIRLPVAFDAKAREDFNLFVTAAPPPSRGAAADQEIRP